MIAAARRHGTHFSITARKDRAVTAAIAAIAEDAWTTIRYPRAVFDDQLQQWVSDAEVAEIPFTAFTSKPKARQVTARLIVRRVRDANPDHVHVNAQGELFRVWRHHAIFTDSPLPMLAAEADHRRHAIIEQVIADLKNGPLAHLPSGSFAANSAWLVLAAIAFNLTRAAGALASSFHAKATTATLRRQLINVAARVTRSARRIDPATTHGLALGRRLAAAVHRRDRTTSRGLNPSTAARPDRRLTVETPSRSAAQPRPQQHQPTTKINYVQSPGRRGGSRLRGEPDQGVRSRRQGGDELTGKVASVGSRSAEGSSA